MPLLSLQRIDYSVGGPPLLDGISLQLERGDRACLIGRNGAGKSTLIRLVSGQIQAEGGEIRLEPGVRIGVLAQEVPAGLPGSVYEVVAHGAGQIGDLLADYELALHAEPLDEARVQRLHDALDAQSGWTLDARIKQVLDVCELDGTRSFDVLSGGMRRRVMLARALVMQPDILLLDEPTNHLDLPAIEWLERLVMDFAGAVLFVTHDRRFLQRVANRILELDRGQLTDWPGDYANYLRRREERDHAEALAFAAEDRKLAAEEVWIRQGIKARRTRNEGRVRALKAMRNERAARRDQQGKVKAELLQADASGKLVFEAEQAGFEAEGRRILLPFSTRVLRSDRLGVIGRNGSGKSTLLRLLLGELAPSYGSIRRGSQLEVAYFDQQRAQLREDWNALDNVSEGAEFIDTPRGRKHVLGYLQDFLFTPDRARAPITMLSGGERHRLLLAKLLARPCNTLVLDEPTNDLDIETLELLEDMLTEFTGTLIVVSHDRALLDAVVTSLLYVDDRGVVHEMVGGYSECSAEMAAINRAAAPAAVSEVPAPPAPTTTVSRPAATPKPAKLGYREQRELAELPQKMAALESEIAALQENLSDPATYRDRPEAVAELNRSLAERQVELDAALERWVELESRTE
ncbi:MAG: ATP-binding cassette domain-containing protein [Xanthomonadales bacterium]|nr:ATP-binding cassette domain-containing protein [Xanthomonadales bacterium]